MDTETYKLEMTYWEKDAHPLYGSGRHVISLKRCCANMDIGVRGVHYPHPMDRKNGLLLPALYCKSCGHEVVIGSTTHDKLTIMGLEILWNRSLEDV